MPEGDYQHTSANGDVNPSIQTTSYYFQRLKKWRGRRDYYRNFLAEMPEEIVALIQVVAA